MKTTKIIQFSDFHNDYDNLDTFIEYVNKRNDIDAVFFSGDILESLLSGVQVGEMNSNLETMIKGVANNLKENSTIEDVFSYARKSDNKDVKNACEKYEIIEEKFKKAVETKYNKFKGHIEKINKKIVMVNGNWDSPIFNKIFEEYTVHKKTKEINGLKIAGYGGANVYPKVMPMTQIMPYDENEFKNYIEKENPDIILSHMPPKDMVDGKDHIGSESLKNYITNPRENSNLKAVFCGHSHEYGSIKEGNVLVVNPGNFGRYRSKEHNPTFAEIEIGNDYTQAKHYQMVGNQIQEIGQESNKMQHATAA